MIDTGRIQSGFDAELMLGKGWLLLAIQTLSSNGVIDLPLGITITDVTIIDDPEWNLELATNIENFSVHAKMHIVDDAFVIETDIGISFQIDIPKLGDLADTPTLKRAISDNNLYENAMALLFNLDIRATPQDQEPLPVGQHLARGSEDKVVSFLPVGQHVALGVARESLDRFANNIWHTELRDVDGSHPLPRPGEDKKGHWNKVAVSLNRDRIKFTLKGEVPIDLWPDADVSLEMKLKPNLVGGKLTFEMDTDLDVDTGFWGDVLGFTIGALTGFLIGIFTGGLILIPSLGLEAVIVLEIGEYAVGEVIERRILAKDTDGHMISGLICNNNILHFAYPTPSEDGFSVGMLDAIPSSIPIYIDKNDPLFNRIISIKSVFDEIELDNNGLAVAGTAESFDLFEVQPAILEEAIYDGDTLKQLRYHGTVSSEDIVLSLEDVLERLGENELKPPLRSKVQIYNPVLQVPAGKLCCPCLKPVQIHRENTIITRIRFDTGLELNTQDAVFLQDHAGVYVKGLQLIHPKNGNPYFRAPANYTTEDNFESLPTF
ncbi:DUF3892 domain-containing protein [Saccharicrinis sp. GN24d3]|uniref:DUF3892 domain-containing protein n=1 Tax=Saccharicrinis sp. GN24d3 TaxID=3458416 RepID=UPI004035DD97